MHLISVLLASSTLAAAEICDSPFCEALFKLREDISSQKHTFAAQSAFDEFTQLQLEDLDRRLRTVEQPSWMIDSTERRWMECSRGPCRCRPETHELTCWHMELLHLPPNQVVPRDIRKIDLGLNYLSSLSKESFHNMVQLMELNLSDNRIDYLSAALFGMLDSLHHLNINRNKLVELPHMLFIRQINLKTVLVSCLTQAFVKQSFACCSENSLKQHHLPLLNYQAVFDTYDFSHNRIRSLPEGLFRSSKKLRTIRFADNDIKEIPALFFSGLYLLEDLDFSSNKLEEIKTETFRGLQSLKGLKLDENKINMIPSGAFFDLTNLEVLSLRRNRLPSISKTLFDNLLRVRALDLSGNLISQISGHEFLRMSAMRELHLGANFLERIPDGTFKNSNRLQSLFLYSNSLQTIQDDAFFGLNNLTYLILNNNLLRNLEKNAFRHLSNLLKLHIDSNKLQFIPDKSFSFLPDLLSVKLAKNPWHCDCSILYLSQWLADNQDKIWDADPICRGPGSLGGRLVQNHTFEELCVGQWLSLTKLRARLPVIKD